MTELDRWKVRGEKQFFRPNSVKTMWSLTGRGRRPMTSKKSLNLPYRNQIQLRNRYEMLIRTHYALEKYIITCVYSTSHSKLPGIIRPT